MNRRLITTTRMAVVASVVLGIGIGTLLASVGDEPPTAQRSAAVAPVGDRRTPTVSAPRQMSSPVEPMSSPPGPHVAESGECDPSYAGVCIPPPGPDLDCEDIPHQRFRIVRNDPHALDGDGDGIGC